MDWTVLRGEKYVLLPGIETRFLDFAASRSLRVHRLLCLCFGFRRGAWKISGCSNERGSGEKIAQRGATYLVLVAWWRGVGTGGWDVKKHAWDRWDFFFSVALQPNAGHDLLILLEVSRSHTKAHYIRQDSSGRVINASQRPVPDNTQQSQQTSMSPVGFEPTISAGERT